MYNGVYNVEQYAYMHNTLTKWLDVKLRGRTVGQCLAEKDVRKIAIYGINGLGEQVYQDIQHSDVEVVCLIDRNAGNFTAERYGLPILSLEQLERIPEDCYILVTPEFYFREIMNDLMCAGIRLDKIISLSMVL